ncbi:MAG: hypothetical protein GXO12_01295 [Epsilonproteobacteria bacterium]|nr:hypothetical protein [Campylobacterota bacterium]
MKKIAIIFLVVVGLLISGCGKKSDPNIKKVVVGEKIEPFTLKTQHDKPMSITDKTKMIIFVFAKGSGHTVKQFLDKQPDDYLSKKNIVFVADVSPMPSLIRKYLAMPDLKSRKYPIMLIYDENFAEQFKNDEKGDDIMIVKLDNLKVKKIIYIKTAEELKRLIDSVK